MAFVGKLLDNLSKDAGTLRYVQEWVNSAVAGDDTNGAESEDQQDSHRDWDGYHHSCLYRWAHQNAPGSHPKPWHAFKVYDAVEGHHGKEANSWFQRAVLPKHPRIGDGDKAETGSVSATSAHEGHTVHTCGTYSMPLLCPSIGDVLATPLPSFTSECVSYGICPPSMDSWSPLWMNFIHFRSRCHNIYISLLVPPGRALATYTCYRSTERVMISYDFNFLTRICALTHFIV